MKYNETAPPKPNPFDELQEILKTMDIPPSRKDHLNWLHRDLEVKNKNHPQFDQAMSLIKRLLFMEN